MNDETRKLIEADKKYLWHPFTQMSGWVESDPVVVDSGDGFYLIDTKGKRYIDGVSSLWCNIHGHRVAAIDDAIRDQLDRIGHSTLLGLGQTRSIELAERLVEIVPPGLEKVFYSDSGATSVEIAIKMAYQYCQNSGQKERKKFIALSDSYHGDTIGSVSVGGMEIFHGIFGSLLFETYYVDSPFPYRFDGDEDACLARSLSQIDALLKERGGEIAAIVVEPLVQGAAGIIVHPKGFLKGVRELADKYDVLLIVDEVATGFGRTGKMLACEHEQVSPDLMCLAKGITGGYLPLAATLATQEIFDAFLGGIAEHKTFYHGHTYTGNALGCAAAIASLDLFEGNKIIASLDEKSELISKHFAKIKELPFIGDVRQCGLMCGIEIVRDKAGKESFPHEATVGAKICTAMRGKGAMMRPLSDVIVVMPPVAMGIELLDELLGIVSETLKNDLPKIVKGL
ncbi:MAG TPA: adenosylmethionine--8-amino-7-oxononanoate transaminase [Phycisphaerales bacterium]|nr:adenosylmethionine--8-amino-7-oxononanoate transaminase [Phycisphaerales bacterium]